VRSRLEGENRFSLHEIYNDFKEMEELYDEVRVFTCVEKYPEHNPDMRKALNGLEFLGFVNFDFKDPAYVEITELGKLFGESSELPPRIGEYVSDKDILKKEIILHPLIFQRKAFKSNCDYIDPWRKRGFRKQRSACSTGSSSA
jgi:hypothetical protein